MRVSVIIPTLNNQTLANTLEALEVQTRPPDEIIVVGRDEIGAARPFPQVRFIDTGRPLCAAAVRNRGMRAAQGDIFLFTDSDCIPYPDWVATHLERQAAGALIVGGSVEIDDPNYWARCDNISMFHEFATSQAAGPRFLLPTLNLSVQRGVWETVGDMDETFPGAAGEDTDWTIRMRQAGYTLRFEPRAAVRHAPARTTWRDVVRHWQTAGHNNIRVRLRYADEYNTPNFVRNPFWLRLLAPLIAARVTLGIYADRAYWRYWNTLPVVYATKIIYCWSAARSVASGFALQ